MKKNIYWRYFYAVGCNPEASRLSGLRVKLIQLISYLIDGLFCGIAGLVMMSRIFSGQPQAETVMKWMLLQPVWWEALPSQEAKVLCWAD